MSAVWPDGLPIALQSMWGQSAIDNRVAKNTEAGPPGYRSRFSKLLKTVDIALPVSRNQVAIIDHFYEGTLKNGSLPFWMDDPVDAGVWLCDDEGNPILTAGGDRILLAAATLFMFGQGVPQTKVYGDRFIVNFSLVKMP